MKPQILFTGYAPVHFLCFKPLYDQLVARGADVFVSGGIRRSVDGAHRYNGPAMYQPLGVPSDRILSTETIQNCSFDLLFSANKRIIAPPENFGAKVQMFHGISFRNRGIRPENLVYDYFFVIGPYMRRKFAESGLMEATDPRGIPIGFPKTDPLVGPAPDRASVLSRCGFDGTRPVILYAPTGEARNSLETMGETVIRNISRAGRYDLLIKPHDHPKDSGTDWFARLAELEGPHVRLTRDVDVIPLLMASDLLITDASSVANEYTLLDRPIVFLDVPELLKNSIATGAALDLDTWGRKGGVVVGAAEDAVDAIDNEFAARDLRSSVRRAIAADLFYNPGTATDAAIDWISDRVPVSRPAS